MTSHKLSLKAKIYRRSLTDRFAGSGPCTLLERTWVGNTVKAILSLLTKLSSEVSEMKDSRTANEEQSLSFENSYQGTSSGSSEKISQSLEDFFKEKLSEKNKKPEEKKNQETHIDDIEERPREKLWKRYGDFRGKVSYFFAIDPPFLLCQFTCCCIIHFALGLLWKTVHFAHGQRPLSIKKPGGR